VAGRAAERDQLDQGKGGQAVAAAVV
jgi:hypothetical protein